MQEFRTLAPDISELGEYLQSENVLEVAIESTANYWIPVWNILEAMGLKLNLVNPYLIKQMPGRKSDIKDAQWIATLLHKGLIRSSLVPNAEIRELRTYSRKYMRLQQKRTSILQEIEKNLDLCCIRMTSFASHIDSKSVMKIVHQLIAGQRDKEVLLALVHMRIVNRVGRENILASLNGFMTEHHRFILELLMEELALNESQTKKCLDKMRILCTEHYSRQMELLQTMPGVSELSAMIVIAESGGDIKEFENSVKFTGWIGLRPRNDESTGKFKSTATTKGNKYLRTILVQIAWAASRTKDSHFKEKIQPTSYSKAKKKGPDSHS